MIGTRSRDRLIFVILSERVRYGPEAQYREIARRLWEISERQCAVSGRSAEPAHDSPSGAGV
jgi:hypothetical protein